MPEMQITLDMEAYRTLSQLIDSRLSRMKENVSAYIEYILIYERILESILEAEKVTATPALVEEPAKKGKGKAKPVAEAPPPALDPPKPTRAPRGSKKMEEPNLCPTHPKYGARRSPRTDCAGCWAAYEKYSGVGQAQLARRNFERKNRVP